MVLAMFVRRNILDAVAESEVAQRANLALRTVEHELDIAREIQTGLLPVGSPKLDGFDIAGMARPATQTGGDYYDWQQLPDGRLLVVIADVTGHGIGPALVTAVCRAYARASLPASLSRGDDLPALMQRINLLLTDDLTNGRFVTFVVAFVCPDTHDVYLCSAGHGPLLVYDAAAGVVRGLEATGIPFGIFADSDYHPPESVPMAPGDVLVLLTDGFFEQPNVSGQRFGLDRLRASIRRHAGHPPAAMIQALHADVLAFAGGAPQGDDLTAVVLRRVGPA
jgi:serine phosphatase RsbU (regulator of sigma subunit)